eukprot:GFUD01040603.1.p1 GENE.GFUD01040603.1~~GFUD01040603.1.p1  ORF type:complete len:108 (+),score=47.40 GFUD01040603.1:67-390(+)
MGNCCGSENDDGPDPEERRRLQAEAAEMRNKDNEGRGLKDPEGAKRRMEQKEEPPWHELELKWHELERRARGEERISPSTLVEAVLMGRKVEKGKELEDCLCSKKLQ